MTEVTVAESPLPDDLSGCEGLWVAIRARVVVARAESADELVADSRVLKTDVLYRVPDAGEHFYASGSSA